MKAFILTYHHVAAPPEDHPGKNLFVTPENFSEQMKFLKNKNFQVVSLDQIRDALLGNADTPPAPVAITFDDGFEDNYFNAFPILKKYGFTATVFMVSGSIGKKQENSGTNADDYLSPEQIREMSDYGICFGSHSQKHVRLATVPPEKARKQIRESAAEISAVTDKPVEWFCYPFGSFSPEIQEMVKEAGYKGASSVIRDNRVFPSQLYHLPRIMVMKNTTISRFRYYFSGLYHFIHRRKNLRRWGKNYIE